MEELDNSMPGNEKFLTTVLLTHQRHISES